jgi:hypothetical protein
MDNAQNCDSYINIPSSQTYTSSIKHHAYMATVCDVKYERI